VDLDAAWMGTTPSMDSAALTISVIAILIGIAWREFQRARDERTASGPTVTTKREHSLPPPHLASPPAATPRRYALSPRHPFEEGILADPEKGRRP
jgi:hypothetical protein